MEPIGRTEAQYNLHYLNALFAVISNIVSKKENQIDLVPEPYKKETCRQFERRFVESQEL